MTEFSTISDNPRVQANYEESRRSGTSHNLAEMFALAQPPMSNTDREFLQGHCNGSQFEKTPRVGDAYRREAAAAGVSTTGKVYIGGLAAFPGDPRAWVSGRGDVVRVAEERELNVSGSVNVRAARPPEPSPVSLTEDIVQREVEQIAAASEAPALVDREDLAAKVREKRTPYWAK